MNYNRLDLSNGLLFFKICCLITATMCAYTLNYSLWRFMKMCLLMFAFLKKYYITHFVYFCLIINASSCT